MHSSPEVPLSGFQKMEGSHPGMAQDCTTRIGGLGSSHRFEQTLPKRWVRNVRLPTLPAKVMPPFPHPVVVARLLDPWGRVPGRSLYCTPSTWIGWLISVPKSLYNVDNISTSVRTFMTSGRVSANDRACSRLIITHEERSYLGGISTFGNPKGFHLMTIILIQDGEPSVSTMVGPKMVQSSDHVSLVRSPAFFRLIPLLSSSPGVRVWPPARSTFFCSFIPFWQLLHKVGGPCTERGLG